jgi:hypothetical protein
LYNKQNDIVNKLKKKFASQIQREKIAIATYRKLSFLQSTSAVIFLGLVVNHFSGSDICTPVLAATGVASTVPSIIKHFDAINSHFTASPLSSFKEYIIAEAYKDYYQKRMGE